MCSIKFGCSQRLAPTSETANKGIMGKRSVHVIELLRERLPAQLGCHPPQTLKQLCIWYRLPLRDAQTGLPERFVPRPKTIYQSARGKPPILFIHVAEHGRLAKVRSNPLEVGQKFLVWTVPVVGWELVLHADNGAN